MSQLLPDGIDHLGDCPYTLHIAIVQTLRVLEYEEFPLDERPPRRIWLDNKRLKEWWADVEKAREAKYSTKDSDDEDDGDYDENTVELITRG